MSQFSTPSRARMTGKAIIGGGGGGGVTSLGTPLQTKTVAYQQNSNQNADQAAAAMASANRQTPTRTTKPSNSSSHAFGSSVRSTPVKTPIKSTRTNSNSTPSASPATFSSSTTAHIRAAGLSSFPSSSPSSTPTKSVIASPRVLSRQRYDAVKASNPFSQSRKFKTSFSEAYVNGRIPCRINHGSINHKLQWDAPSSQLDYNWLLPVVCDGLIETEHPYVVIAPKAFHEMLAEGGQHKLVPIIPKLIQPLRRALMEPGTFVVGCDAVISLSKAVGPLLNEHIDLLVQQINKKSLNSKLADKVNETILALAENGGDDAIKIIKKRVPAFTCQ